MLVTDVVVSYIIWTCRLIFTHLKRSYVAIYLKTKLSILEHNVSVVIISPCSITQNRDNSTLYVGNQTSLHQLLLNPAILTINHNIFQLILVCKLQFGHAKSIMKQI